MQAEPFSLVNHEWYYRGEGNANLVICLPQERKILRFRKSLPSEECNEIEIWSKLEIEIRFISVVMRTLLGKSFVSPPSLVNLPRNEIAMLNSVLQSQRPGCSKNSSILAHRQHKGLAFCGAELCQDLAVFSTNSSQAPIFCVELKPKQGIFPPSVLRSGNCLFCKKQYFKMKIGQTSCHSQYCPMDLFSGDTARMQYALKCLLQTPQNNLKIFKDGSLIYSEGNTASELKEVLADWWSPGYNQCGDTDLESKFCSLLLQALTKPIDTDEIICDKWKWDGFSQDRNKRSVEMEENQFEAAIDPSLPVKPCDWTKVELPKNCVLHRLARVQALDTSGPNHVQDVYLSQTESWKAERLENSQFGYVNSAITKGSSSKLDIVECYLIAASANDCSLLITLQEQLVTTKTTEQHKDLEIKNIFPGKDYRLKISVVDIDPKPISCIERHCKRNTTISGAFTESFKQV